VKLTHIHLPTQQEFQQNPYGWLSAVWVLSSAVTATFIPRATVITLTLLGVSILAVSIRKKRLPPLPHRLFTGMFASVFLLAAAGFLWSQAPEEITRRLPRLGLLFAWGLLALAAIQQVTPKIAEGTMTLTILAIALALVVIAIEINFDFILYRTLVAVFTQNTKPVFINANFVNQPALLTALYLWPVSLALWLKGYRILSITLIAFALVIFIPSNSQSVGLALFLGILASFFTALFPRLMKISFSFAIIGFMVAMPVIPQFLQSLVQAYEIKLPASGLYRLDIWNFVMDKILQQPYLGYGLEASRVIGANTGILDHTGAPLRFLHPHNGFLQTWLELGLAGYVILGLLCLWIVHRISLLSGARKVFSSGLLVCGLSLFAMTYGMWQSWIIAAEFSVAGALLLTLKLVDNTHPTISLSDIFTNKRHDSGNSSN
jgi:O-antigen ligase